jgi:hypothetical protein
MRSVSFSPLVDVAEHRLDAAVREGLDAVLDDGAAAADAERLLDLDLDGQAVRVPAAAARHVVTRHRAMTQEHVLHHAREHVARMRHAVGRGRALVEDEGLLVLRLLHGALEDALGAPEVEEPQLQLGEGDLARNTLEHRRTHTTVTRQGERC